MGSKHFTYEERKAMEDYLKLGITRKEIAHRLNKAPNTIYREYKRGLLKQETNGVVIKQYSASKAEEQYQEGLHSSKNNTLYYKKIEEITRLLREGNSPETVADKLGISKTTVYSYIKKGRVPEFTEEELRKRHRIVKVFSDGHIILPKALRSELSIEDGQQYKIHNDGAVLTLKPIPEEKTYSKG